MRSTRPVYSTVLFLFLTLLTTTIIVRAAAETDETDEYDVKARVVRISFITGEVNLKRNGNTEWERAQLNFALVEGDTISTAGDSRVEIQIDARNFVRLGADSILRIGTLRDQGVALSVIEGTASVRLAKFDRDHEYFEVDAPKTTLAAEKTGMYRIDVSREGRVRLSARDGGRARIYSETSGFALRDGRTAELIYEGADAGDWEFVAANASDSWDNWVHSREQFLSERLHYDVQYYDNYVWGAEDLDAYGDWTYVNDYGWIWRPHTTVINIYNDWAPYRYGRWCWVEPYGWTWVGYEPWGWAPYHYGRWVYYNNYWAWCPRSHYYGHRSWWRPALVAFHISFGNDVCWYPLSYHQRDPHSRNYPHNYHSNSDRLRPMRADELSGLRRVNPAYYRAVTAVAAKDFGAEGVRMRPAGDVIARRAVSAEPLRTDLPIRPAYALREGTTGGDRTEGVTVARPASVRPQRELPERSTGAAVRSPGVALDSELRRSRILNGREARPDILTSTAGVSGAVQTRPTGAVARPAHPLREGEPRIDGGRDVQRTPDSPATIERPARPVRTAPVDDVPARPESNERERVPLRPRSNAEATPNDRPARPERMERPARPETTEPARIERPEHRDRPEAPARNAEPAPRYEPPRRSDPPPRNDPPPRSDPPARSDPPPQRSGRSREDNDRPKPSKVKDPR